MPRAAVGDGAYVKTRPPRVGRGVMLALAASLVLLSGVVGRELGYASGASYMKLREAKAASRAITDCSRALEQCMDGCRARL